MGWIANASACASLVLWNFQAGQHVLGWVMMGTVVVSILNALSDFAKWRSRR